MRQPCQVNTDNDTQGAARPARPDERDAIDELLTASWGAPLAAANGRLYDLRTFPTLVVERDGALVGVLTYEIVADAVEVVSIDATPPRGGVGTTLLRAAADVGRAHGCARLWLITTNDNLDALRFYQRRGMAITDVRLGAVTTSRQLKPSIPEIGAYGIPLRDEIVLTMPLVR
jgi:GNAT superfamily N-acetyltransferase